MPLTIALTKIGDVLVVFFCGGVLVFCRRCSRPYSHIIPETDSVFEMMDGGIVVSEFELKSRYYVRFQTNNPGKGINPLILQAMA